MKLVQTQSPDFYRDTDTNAVINTNVAAFNLYKQQRKGKETIESLKQEVEDLKALVRELIEKQK